jgi:cytidylate kinase
MSTVNPQIITIDGPSGVGKGTISALLAEKLGWHFLDSGVLYRVAAYAALKHHVSLENEAQLADVARNLKVTFSGGQIFFEDEAVESKIREEHVGNTASKIGAYQAVRDSLFELQRSFAKAPGLVTDGRDMGTAIFPEAALKIFLTASSKERAERRFLQLQSRGIHVSIHDLLREIEARDERDQTRAASPLKPAKDAVVIDTSALSIDEVFAQIWEKVMKIQHNR